MEKAIEFLTVIAWILSAIGMIAAVDMIAESNHKIDKIIGIAMIAGALVASCAVAAKVVTIM